MNGPVSTDHPGNPELKGAARGRLLRACALGFVASVALVTTGCFRISAETRELRDAVLESVEGDVRMDKEIEVTAGAVTLGLVRTISRFADDLPPEARLGLQAVRRAEVGIYALRGHAGLDRAGLVRASTESLRKRGWERAVCVLDHADTVMVFVPENLQEDDHLEVCVLVVDQADLVVAKARLARKPLGRLIATAIQNGREAAGGDDAASAAEVVEVEVEAAAAIEDVTRAG